MAIKTQAELEKFIGELEELLGSIEELVEWNIPFSGDTSDDCVRVDLTNHLNALSYVVNGLALEDTVVQADWEQHSLNHGFVKDGLALHHQTEAS